MKVYTVKGKNLIYGNHFEVEVESYSHGEAVAKFEKEHPTAFAIEVDGYRVNR